MTLDDLQLQEIFQMFLDELSLKEIFPGTTMLNRTDLQWNCIYRFTMNCTYKQRAIFVSIFCLLISCSHQVWV